MSGSRQSKRNNKAKKKLPKNVELKFKVRERDERIEREHLKGKIQKIYTDWKQEFINKPKRPEELADAVNELRAKLAREMPPEMMEHVEQTLLEPIMARLHYSAITVKHTVQVYADCPNEPLINAERTVCGWGGVVGVPLPNWQSGKVDFPCPKCGHVLVKKDMAEVVDVNEIMKDYKEGEDEP